MTITFVKKILASGDPCKKCQEVEDRLRRSGYIDSIDKTIIADERDPESEGMQLAKLLEVNLAPFFIVEDEGPPRIYTVYFKFIKAELDQKVESSDRDAQDILRANPDLDLL